MSTGIYIAVGQSIFAQESGNYYKVIKHIGRGGNAIAFQVLCTKGPYIGSTFALKLQYNLSTAFRRDRFLRETAFLKSENHPAILGHIDEGEYRLPNQKTFPFVVTTYCPNTLETVMHTVKIDVKTKVLYACQLVGALLYLKNKNVIHRDIKPGNIFINGSNAILGDFGLMKILKNEEYPEHIEDDIQMVNETAISSSHGYVAMPYYYRTPELVAYARKEDRLHIESDVFQLGLVLTELFTGENPLIPSRDLTEPVRLNRVGQIFGTNNRGLIFKTLSDMIKLDYRERPPIEKLIETFELIYELENGLDPFRNKH